MLQLALPSWPRTCGALSPQQYLHYISVQVVDVIANSHSDHQSHIWPRVACGGIRACWRIEGSTGASALPRVTNDHAECCCWWEYRLAPHFSVVLHSISTSRIGCVAAPCAASLADCGCALLWYLVVETKCMQGVRRCGPLARALTCRNCVWAWQSQLLVIRRHVVRVSVQVHHHRGHG